MGTELLVMGVSHRTTPLEIREKLSVGDELRAAHLERLVREGDLSEAVLLSTCNRVELIAVTANRSQARKALLAYFAERAAPATMDERVYEHIGLEAVQHLFRVASGLDSMVLGEPQILGQVKDAFTTATQRGTLGTLLSRCFDRAFRVAKRVRSETRVAEGNVSVSSIACDLAEKIFGSLQERTVLLVGAGEMGEAAAKSLAARGSILKVINRNPERAQKLAEACGGEPRPLEALATELAEADVVISSTSKNDYVITYDLMQGVGRMRRFKPLFLIDIAVPRDIDPRVDSLRNVFLYDVDDLEKVSRENLSARQRATADADAIIKQEVDQFERWLSTLSLTPTIVALRQHVRSVVLREKDKARARLSELSPQQEKALDAMCEGIVNQLLHSPLTELKRSSDQNDGKEVVQTVRRLFSLAEDGAEQDNHDTSAGELAPASGRRRS